MSDKTDADVRFLAGLVTVIANQSGAALTTTERLRLDDLATLVPQTPQDAWREADREERIRQLARLGAAMPRLVIR